MGIQENIKQITQAVAQATQSGHRQADAVWVLAASKQQSADKVREAYHGGIIHFGENYLQEAQHKIQQLSALPLHWHFIGSMQRNKAKSIATLFEWVHTINTPEIAHALNKYRGQHAKPLQVCLQVNLVDEKTKAGIAPSEVEALARTVCQLPHLQLRGLMTIPPPMTNAAAQYAVYDQLHQLQQTLNRTLGLHMDTLSMGMSDDFIPAIQAGATIVRIGRGIFGKESRSSLCTSVL